VARFTFRLPDIGEGIAEAEIVAWHVKIGDRVEEDQNLADMMTDKATVEMESPVSGTVVELAGEVGDQVPIGSALVVIETESEAAAEQPAAPAGGSSASSAGRSAATPSSPSDAPAPPEGEDAFEAENPGVEEADAATPSAPVPASEAKKDAALRERQIDAGHEAKVLASPAVRARAKDLGVDLGQVQSDGDRIRHADLDAYLRYSGSQGYSAPGRSRSWDDQSIRVIGMRRRIAENMAAAKRNIPHFTYVDEVEVTELERMRASLNDNRGSRPKLTMLPLFMAALCRALPDFPMLNARYDDEANGGAGVVTRSGRVHLGMATQTDAGLTVPVIRDAQDRNVWQLAAEIARLAEAARTGKITSEELGGGTITVTSLGPLGGIATTPVINRPEVAIVGPNKVTERPVFDGDDIRRAKLMNVSISCDHRVVDGWDAASFVQLLKKYMETPVLLFAD